MRASARVWVFVSKNATTHSFRILSFVVFDVELSPCAVSLGFAGTYAKMPDTNMKKGKMTTIIVMTKKMTQLLLSKRKLSLVSPNFGERFIVAALVSHIAFTSCSYTSSICDMKCRGCGAIYYLACSYCIHRTQGSEKWDLPKVTFTAEGNPSLRFWFNDQMLSCDFL